MKRILASMIAMTLAGAATAGTLGLELGTNFFDPSAAGAQVDDGQSVTVAWNLDSDISVGMYFERSSLGWVQNNTVLGGHWGADTLTVNALQVSKSVVKNVNVGLRFGSGTSTDSVVTNLVGPVITTTTATAALVDIVGQVKILSGSGEKVEGALVGTVAARFSNPTPNPSMDGVNFGLGVLVEF